MTGLLFNIQRFSIHDGPGIRTNVFFKGCPLRCAWCHNPEGLTHGREISFFPDKCVHCGACAAVCGKGAHVFAEEHLIDRDKCVRCGACVQACAYGALEETGKAYTVEEVVREVERDRLFYGTDGGATLTGGEPMAQPAFAIALAKRLREEGISVCVETSGAGAREAYREMLPYVDYFLFDIKETDAARYRQYTGGDMKAIFGNLAYLDENGAKTVLRCPVIPDVNMREEHFYAVASLAAGMKNVCGIDLEPYHPMGLGKAKRVGREMAYKRETLADKKEIEEWAARMRERTCVPVRVQ